jgi:ACS family tartrate transporter-like MFS transporter
MTSADESVIGRRALRRVSLRLFPFLIALYLWSWIDRTNLAIAALEMNRDLHLSASAYGFGAGVFFLGYALFEIPSNLILARVGARRWIARIAITWGLVATAMMFVRTPLQFYVLRVVLGFAEAGFFPGIIYYLSLWFPARERAGATARFMIAAPLAGIVGNALGGWILGFDGRFGLHGWQWLFLLEGMPSIVLGAATLVVLSDGPESARWLPSAERDWLVARLQNDAATSARQTGPLEGLRHPLVWLLATTNFLMAMPLFAYAFWSPLFVRDAVHTTPAATGLVLAGVAVIAAAAMLVNSRLADRSGDHCLYAAAGAGVAACGCLGAALLGDPYSRVAALALVEIGGRSYVPPFLCLAPSLTSGPAAAAAIALVNTVFSLGGFVGPSVVGWFTDATGTGSGALLVLSGTAVATAVLCGVSRSAFGVRARTAPDSGRAASGVGGGDRPNEITAGARPSSRGPHLNGPIDDPAVQK